MLVLILGCTIAASLGWVASLSFKEYEQNIFDFILAIILGNAIGLVLHHFVEDSQLLSLASSALVAVFSKDIVEEIREIIRKGDEYVDKKLDERESNKK